MNCEFWNSGNSSYNSAAITSANIMPGAWNHIGVTYDTATLKIYANGVVGATVGSVSNQTTVWDAGNWTIGAWGATEIFTGNIDGVRIAKVVRSQAWFDQVYKTGLNLL